MTTYVIAEPQTIVGSAVSRDNGRQYLNERGTLTPAADEAAEFESAAEAEAAKDAAGLPSFVVEECDW